MYDLEVAHPKHNFLLPNGIVTSNSHLCRGNIATMGKFVTQKQFNILKYAGITKIFWGLDPDAWEDGRRMITKNCMDFTFYDMVPDVGDLGDRTMLEVFHMWQNAPLYDQNRLVLDI